MPSIRQSQNVNLTGWQQSPPQSDLQQAQPASQPPQTGGYPSMSPYMLSSMPLMASTNDALTQFYGVQSIPTFRTVPLQHGGAS